MPPELSSVRVRIGRRRLVTSRSPTPGMIRPIATRLCSIDMNSVMSSAQNDQVSTTCWPVVLMTRTVWPRRRRIALPRRAGISISTALPPCWPRSWRALEAEIGEAGVERLGLGALQGAILAGRDDRRVFGAGRRLARGEPPARQVSRTRAGLFGGIGGRAGGEPEHQEEGKPRHRRKPPESSSGEERLPQAIGVVTAAQRPRRSDICRRFHRSRRATRTAAVLFAAARGLCRMLWLASLLFVGSARASGRHEPIAVPAE